MQVFKQIGKIVVAMVTVAIVIILLCNVYIIVACAFFHVAQPSVFGYSSAVVISGSMEDAISVNDMVVVHEECGYEVGDIVMYRSGSALVTHRVIEKTADGYITKGDANNTDDGEIDENRMVGKVVLIIPKVGAVIEVLQTPLGMMIMLFGLFTIIQWPYVAEKFSRKNQE